MEEQKVDHNTKIQIIVLSIGFVLFEIFLLYVGILVYRQIHIRDSMMYAGMILFPIAIIYLVKRK